MTIIAADQASLSLVENDDLVPVAALRRHELLLSRAVTDVTEAGGDGWRHAAVIDRPLTAELRATGVFVSGNAMAAIRSAVLSATASEFALDLPGEGTWRGSFFVTTLSLSGQAEDEVMVSLRLTSTGAVAFTTSL